MGFKLFRNNDGFFQLFFLLIFNFNSRFILQISFFIVLHFFSYVLKKHRFSQRHLSLYRQRLNKTNLQFTKKNVMQNLINLNITLTNILL
jgi:hypothetical protein